MKPDNFALGGFTFTATFYPDYVLEDGKRATRSMEFNNPVFFISVGQDGKNIGEGLVPKNGSLEFAGYRLEMRDMPFWVRFYVVKQRGLSILYAGFATCHHWRYLAAAFLPERDPRRRAGAGWRALPGGGGPFRVLQKSGGRRV